MIWLWLGLSWLVVACLAGLWLGAALRVADRTTSLADEVEAWVRRETPERLTR